MVTEDDLLASLDSDGTAFADVSNTSTLKGSKSKKVNLWDKTDFDPLKIDSDTFKKTGKTFTVAFSKQGKDIDEATLGSFLKVAKVLASRGYTFRYNGSSEDKLQNSILALDGMVSEIYLPWKNINKNISSPTLAYPTETAYRMAAALHKSFAKLPASVRAILASDIHSMLGKECNSPVDLLLAHSPCGSEKFVKEQDFKKLGYLSFYLSITKATAVPVFNLQKEDAINRIVEFLKSSHTTTTSNNSIEVTDGMDQI